MSADQDKSAGPLSHVIGSKGKINGVLRGWIKKALQRPTDRGAPGEQR